MVASALALHFRWQDIHVEGAVLGGVISPPLTPSMFTDLFDDSCTNGWVMGNIATSPQDAARFFHALLAGEHARSGLFGLRPVASTLPGPACLGTLDPPGRGAFLVSVRF